MKNYIFEELHIGLTAEIEKTISHEDIIHFTETSGDKNPAHLDANFAKKKWDFVM